MLIGLAFGLYSVGMTIWFVFISNVARLEQDVGERFLRLSGWPTGVMLMGTVWTLLLVACAVGAARARGWRRVVLLATAAAGALLVQTVVPSSFRALGYIGPSTSEFLDTLLPLVGGFLPGGQATLGLLATTALLATWTVVETVRLQIARARG